MLKNNILIILMLLLFVACSSNSVESVESVYVEIYSDIDSSMIVIDSIIHQNDVMIDSLNITMEKTN